jgi:integrase
MKKETKIFKADKKNTKIIEDYLSYYKAKKPNHSERTIRSIKSSLEHLASFLQDKTSHKTLKPAPNERIMLNFFNDRYYVPLGSYNLMGQNIIPFYRYVNKVGKHSRPKNMDWFESTSERTKKRLRDPHRKEKLLLTIEEYEEIMRYSKDFYGQNKAIWETYYLSGFRPEELQSMTINDVNEIIDENNNAVVWISCPKSKTYPREICLPEYPENLMRYLGNHPLKNKKDAPLWFILKGSIDFKQLEMKSIRRRFDQMKKNLNLKKTLTIKSFRKTRGTILFNTGKDTTTIGKYMGWDENTVAIRRKEYNLYNKEDLKKNIISEPMKSKSYDTIKTDLDRMENRYKPIIEKQINEIKDLKKRLNDNEKVLSDNRQEFKDTKEELQNNISLVIQEFSNVVNKVWFSSNKLHRKKLEKMDLKYKKLYKEGKLTKEEYVNKFKEEADKYYEKSPKAFNLNKIDDLKNLKKNAKDKFIAQLK